MASDSNWGKGGAVIFPDVWRSMQLMGPDDQLAYFRAICRATIDGEAVDIDDLPPMAGVLFGATVDRVRKSQANRRNGSKGGNAKAARSKLRRALESGAGAAFDDPDVADVNDWLELNGWHDVSATDFCTHYRSQRWLMDSGEVPGSWTQCVPEWSQSVADGA